MKPNVKSNRAIKKAIGIFKSEKIFLSPEFVEELMDLYNIQNKDSKIILVLKKGSKDGK